MVEFPKGEKIGFRNNYSDAGVRHILGKILQHQEMLLPYIRTYIGKRNLDIGCGTGIPSVTHQEKLGVSPTLCDSVDMRDELARHLPFKIIDHNKLPFPDKSFDTSYMQYVLHHTSSASDAAELLSEAFRVAPRVLLVEEICGERTDVARARRFDGWMNDFMHPGVPMPVHEYFFVEQLENEIKRIGHRVIYHAVVSLGFKE